VGLGKVFIKFWLDVWCGDVSLKESFLELFLIAREKEALVADHLHFFLISNKFY
jgi:hypothetical protein